MLIRVVEDIVLCPRCEAHLVVITRTLPQSVGLLSGELDIVSLELMSDDNLLWALETLLRFAFAPDRWACWGGSTCFCTSTGDFATVRVHVDVCLSTVIRYPTPLTNGECQQRLARLILPTYHADTPTLRTFREVWDVIRCH